MSWGRLIALRHRSVLNNPLPHLSAHPQHEITHAWEARLSADDLQRTRIESPPTSVQQHPVRCSTEALLDPDEPNEPSAGELADLSASVIRGMVPPPPSSMRYLGVPMPPRVTNVTPARQNLTCTPHPSPWHGHRFDLLGFVQTGSPSAHPRGALARQSEFPAGNSTSAPLAVGTRTMQCNRLNIQPSDPHSGMQARHLEKHSHCTCSVTLLCH